MNNSLRIGAQYASPGSGRIARVAADERLPATLLRYPRFRGRFAPMLHEFLSAQ